MRRVLFATIALAILLGLFSSVLAIKPQRVEQSIPAQLGKGV